MLKVKCAEIYCNTLVEPNLCIVCVCGKSMLDYDDFSQHFYSEHLQAAKHKLTENATGKDALEEEPLLAADRTLTESEDDALTPVTECDEIDRVSAAKRRAYKPRNKPNTCTYCGRIFRRRYLLDTHLNIHTGRKPHQCDKCGKQFRAVSTLTRHLRTHEQRVEQQCKHCDKQFTHRSALLSHEMRHTQVRRFACDQCNKSFYTCNQLETHQRKLHTKVSDLGIDNSTTASIVALLPFACELCSNSYRSASMLSTHKLKKHYRLAKFGCLQCDKKFVDAARLQQHQLIHVMPVATIK